MGDLNKSISNIKVLATDVDGVLTDSTILFGSDGTEYKKFSVEDGAGAAYSNLAGIPVVFISARFSVCTAVRASEMNVARCYQGSLNKLEQLSKVCNDLSVTEKEIAYIGDGLVDIPVMEKVGVSFTVPNAHQMVKDVADHMTSRSGGEGAFREVVDFILKEKGIFEEVYAKMKKNIYKSND
tara:strand:- start:72 stop:617 length:546 start_codon:yes stop_codon:yes gene_type:complete